MKDIFIEKIVARKNGPFELFIKILSVLSFITISVFLNSITFLIRVNFLGISIAITIGLAYLTYRMIRSVDSEFEYAIVNDEFTIDRIVAKTKRKRMFSASCKDFSLSAAVDSDHYVSALEKNVALFDYSSRSGTSPLWFFCIRQKNVDKLIIIDFDPRFVEVFRRYNPRKVHYVEETELSNED
ncbi:MAG: hypothetical protein GXY06_01935 [Clostridiaceae bacterium]|nr:hypothetical protein [Clostridiaceae bacterium]